MPQLFGTDGVRGKAGDYPLDHATVARLGAALVRAMRARQASDAAPLHRRPRHARVGRWIERELARGAGSRGRERHERRRHPDAGDRLRHAARSASTPAS